MPRFCAGSMPRIGRKTAPRSFDSSSESGDITNGALLRVLNLLLFLILMTNAFRERRAHLRPHRSLRNERPPRGRNSARQISGAQRRPSAWNRRPNRRKISRNWPKSRRSPAP
jgi:hypothetical protein